MKCMKSILSLICGSYRAVSEYQHIDYDDIKLSQYCHRHYRINFRKMLSKYDSDDKYYKSLSTMIGSKNDGYIPYCYLFSYISLLIKRNMYNNSINAHKLEWIEKSNNGHGDMVFHSIHDRLSSYTHRSYY